MVAATAASEAAVEEAAAVVVVLAVSTAVGGEADEAAAGAGAIGIFLPAEAGQEKTMAGYHVTRMIAEPWSPGLTVYHPLRFIEKSACLECTNKYEK